MRKDTPWERLRQRLCGEAGLDPASEELEALKIEEAMQRQAERQVEACGLFYWHYMEFFNQQDGRCAICHREPTWKYPDILVIDHDHSVTHQNVFRGLLCRSCNVGLGHFRDDITVLEAAIAYLKTTPRYVGMTKNQERQAIRERRPITRVYKPET